jgi:hypothetical protein
MDKRTAAQFIRTLDHAVAVLDRDTDGIAIARIAAECSKLLAGQSFATSQMVLSTLLAELLEQSDEYDLMPVAVMAIVGHTALKLHYNEEE